MISSTIHDGTTKPKGTSRRARGALPRIAGTANPVNTAAGQNVTQYNKK